MKIHRLLAAIGTSIVILLNAGHALAASFTPVLDEFWIVKDSIEIFRDSFSDTLLPPSGPDDGVVNPTTYSVFGASGFTSETSGKLTMTPLLGDPVLITTTYADYSTNATRMLATNDNNANFLGYNSSFEIHGLYDMTSIPTITGQSFGIRASDRAPVIGNEGNNTFGLFVGVNSATGKVVVALREFDFSTNTSTVFDSVSIDSYLSQADQIELILAKNKESNALTASFSIFDSSGLTLYGGSLAVTSALIIYDGEDFIRGEFLATDRTSAPVPEPTTILIFGTGLAGLAVVGRKKRS